MYSLSVRSHVMIAHSFRGEVFGPAQGLHGATYVVDAAFHRATLDEDGLVIDIGIASRILDEILAPVNYQNLDKLPQFKGQNTTTEFLAAWIHGALAGRLAAEGLGAADGGPESVSIKLHESHVAWAGFEGPNTPDASSATSAGAPGGARGN